MSERRAPFLYGRGSRDLRMRGQKIIREIREIRAQFYFYERKISIFVPVSKAIERSGL